MVKNTPNRIDSLLRSSSPLLMLLSWVAQVEGQTFSWYTSKKGRTWLSLKHNGTPTYSTSAEYPDTLTDEQTLDTLAMLIAHHLPKLLTLAPPITTWHAGTPSLDELLKVYTDLQALLPELKLRVEEARQVAPPTLKAMLDAEGLEMPVAPDRS